MPENNKILLEAYRNLKHKVSGASSQSLRDSLKKYGDTIEFRYKYCPDLKENPLAINAAKAIVSAEHLGRSEDVYQTLTGGNQSYEVDTVFEVAEKLGLDMDQFKAHFNSDETLERIHQDIEDSKTCGLWVFPGICIDGSPYNGAWDDDSLFAAIENRGGKQIEVALDSFFSWGASAAAVLIFATIGALLIVNLGLEGTYEHWRHLTLGLTVGKFSFMLPLEVWINDFFMAIFFLMIGLEIKKEVLEGELSDAKKAAMPVIGAVGGMLIPAVLYAVTNVGTETAHGWGIPMATDIAFTLGLMALLGSRVPISLKIFISALAVADDLGAIVVIALFYGHGFHWMPFIGALVIVGIMLYMHKKKVYDVTYYVLLGLVLWFMIYQSGLHATLAGVLTAVLIPSRRNADLSLIARQTSIVFDKEIRKIEDDGNDQKHIGFASLELLRHSIERLREPSDHLMHSLEKLVNFIILPLFAFFNTGILLSGADLDFMAPVSIGIMLGLIVGKPLGIVGICWIASKLKIAQLSPDFNWRQLIGAASLAGVGFTMSIVVASSAFDGELLITSKVSILIASTLSAIAGIAILRMVTRTNN